MSEIIPFPGQRVMHLVADCQNEKEPEPKQSGIAKYINSFSRPPEPKIDPKVQLERDVSELRQAICRMSVDHGWDDAALLNFVHKVMVGA